MKKRNKKRLNIKKGIKILGVLVKISLIFLMIYVVIERCGEINGIDFFFTTWN